MNSRFFFYLSIFLIIALLLQGGCNYFENRKQQSTIANLQKQADAGAKEVLRIDTILKQFPPQYIYSKPQIIKDSIRVPFEVTKYLDKLVFVDSTRAERDSLESLLREHFAFRVFTDSFSVHNGAKGAIVDTVFRNDIIGRNIYIPPYTEATVKETIQRRRAILYAVATLQGNRKDIINGFGGGLMLKLPNDKAFEAQALYNSAGVINYQASYKQPIKLRK